MQGGFHRPALLVRTPALFLPLLCVSHWLWNPASSAFPQAQMTNNSPGILQTFSNQIRSARAHWGMSSCVSNSSYFFLISSKQITIIELPIPYWASQSNQPLCNLYLFYPFCPSREFCLLLKFICSALPLLPTPVPSKISTPLFQAPCCPCPVWFFSPTWPTTS